MIETYEKIAILTTVIFSSSLISTVSIIPIIHKIGIKFNVIDKPDHRKIHKGKIVRLGGLGIFLGLIIGLLMIYGFRDQVGFLQLQFGNILLVFFGSLFFLTIGFMDDLINLSPFLRLALQFIVTIILFSKGLNVGAIDITWLNFDLGYLVLNKFFGIIFISFWVVGLTNAINWLDGLDALASGISIIAILTLDCIFIALEKWDLFFLCAAFSGAIIGFLRYNIHPAKIMMGDCGSYFIGSSLGILSIIGLSYQSNIEINSNVFLENIKIFPIQWAILIFFVPLFDMCYVIFIRIINGYSPFYPDRNHIHHNILKRGINERSTSIILYSVSVLFGIFALYSFGLNGSIFYFCGAFLVLLMSLLYVLNMKMYLNQKSKL